MSLTDEQCRLLNEPLDKKHVKKPTGRFGPKGDYLEGWHVINEANRIFGFDGWSYHTDLQQVSLVEATDSNGNPQWQAAYTCVCGVTVGDAFRQDIGFGSGFAKQIGDAIEGATKEAATDALKRALRTFGNQFGLALYDKDRANVADAPPPTITTEQRDMLQDMFDATSTNPAPYLERAGQNTGQKVASLTELPAQEFEPLMAHLRSKKEKENS